MESERNETYERIPWETLDEKKPDRQWLMMAVAGAVVLGAIAYSFMSNRPAPVPVASSVAAADPETTAATAPPPQVLAPPVASTAPIVTGRSRSICGAPGEGHRSCCGARRVVCGRVPHC